MAGLRHGSPLIRTWRMIRHRCLTSTICYLLSAICAFHLGFGLVLSHVWNQRVQRPRQGRLDNHSGITLFQGYCDFRIDSRLTGFFRARPPPVRKAGRYPGAHHRTRAPAGSPVAPPDAWPRATPAVDTVSRSIPRRHPRTGGRSAAWNR